MIKLALAGCAHIHTPGFLDRILKRSGEIQTALVWDPEPARAQKAAEKLGARLAQTPAELWNDPEIKGVVVCSQTGRHEELVTAAAQAGKNLFVEKPLGMRTADALRMARVIENAGVIFQTGYFMRGTPALRFLRDKVRTGAFGTITHASFSNCHSGSLGGWFDTEWRWMADPALAGCGAFGDLGTHGLDILMWWFGDTVTRVSAEITEVTGRYPGCDENGIGSLLFASGVTATLNAGWVNVANPVTATISGTKAYAMICEGKLRYWNKEEGADGSEKTDLPEALPHAFELYLDALQGKDVPLVAPREAAARNAVMEALYASAQAQSWRTPAPLL